MPLKKKRRPSVSRKLKIAMLTCFTVALMLVVGAGYMVQQERLAKNAAEAASFTPKPLNTSAPTEEVEPVTAAILGDSYTAGAGTSEGYGYANVLARLMGWDATILGQGGTGYTNPGQAEEDEATFPDRVTAIVEADPAVVVIQGSTNDFEPGNVAAAAGTAYSEIREALPEAGLVVVGPVGAPDAHRPTVDAVRAILAETAAAHDARFIDPIELGWLDDPALFSDGLHPTTEGHQRLAELLRDELEAQQP